MNSLKTLRITALIAALSLLFLISFESFHTGHQETCHNEDCPICLVLQIIQNTNKFFCDSNTTFPVNSSFFYINIFIFSVLLFVPATLVSQKVKLVI
ncbi:MAG: hypothetical protein K6A43_10230 [Treponema sp.]|nr:hypothetical protein [Treponema sp.]